MLYQAHVLGYAIITNRILPGSIPDITMNKIGGSSRIGHIPYRVWPTLKITCIYTIYKLYI